ncbi:MAG: polyketide synthase [Candidatus Marinimicrobia bacterium]|nr:polyketide synthase [Candidatus Neomarinimicrobiota bacterium]
MDNKKFRRDLFVHLDGIALIAPLACLFDTDFKEISDLKENNTKIKFRKLTEYNINQDYLNVTLRLFESQGWIKREKNNQEFDIKITENGKKIFKELNVYKKFFLFYKELSNLSFLDSEIYQLLNIILDEFSNLKTDNKIIKKHIEGLIVGPILVTLFMNGYAKINQNNKLLILEDIENKNKDFVIKLFKRLQFFDENLILNEKGLFFCKRSSAYGVTVSYMPLFAKMNTLLFKDTSNILNRDSHGNELHVNRKMNVWGSGGAHKLYFKKIDEIIIEIFNYPIEKQPKGIADMGCGDGTMLIHLYNLIKTKTLRGQLLDKYPLHVIGADFNEEALEVTHENLKKENIKHILVQADIGNPDDFNKILIEKYNIELNMLLNVRSFLDHNRVFEMPKKEDFNLNNITTQSTAAFCANNKNKMLEPIIFKLSLIEHFLKWKPYINKFGLILLELHTIKPELCSKNIGNTVATAYDATHGYSNQYIIEYEEFVDAAVIAGLKFEQNFEFNFPSKELTTVSINLISS